MKNEIVEIVSNNFKKTRGGTTMIELRDGLDLTVDEIKTLLNELHAEKKIRIRQGINQKLIYPYL